MQNHGKRGIDEQTDKCQGEKREVQLELQMMSNFPIASNTNS